MRTEIAGVLNQVLKIQMDPGERVWAQKQALVSLTAGLRWTVKVPGGIPGMILRYLSGESFFLVRADAVEAGTLHLAAKEPSVIYPWDLSEGPVTTLRGNFLAATGDVRIEVGIARRPLAALLGGAGLLLQTVSGTGTAYISAKGDVREVRLAEGAGIRVATGNLAAFGGTVDYDVRLTGGLKKILLGGEGAVMTRIGGPGLALTQSLKRRVRTGKKILKVLQSFA